MKNFIRRWLGLDLEVLPRATELRRGAIYVIECEEELNAESLRDIEAHLAKAKGRLGCDFLVLDRGQRIAITEVRAE